MEELSRFLASVAEPTPAPGGGTSSGVVCALAAALVEMSARLGERADDAAAAAELRARALTLAEDELTSYAPVLAASTDEERSRALETASGPPARIAETAAEVAQLGARVADAASKAVRGDAQTGVTLASAAATAAARLVEINLESGPLVARARDAARRAAGAESAEHG